MSGVRLRRLLASKAEGSLLRQQRKHHVHRKRQFEVALDKSPLIVCYAGFPLSRIIGDTSSSGLAALSGPTDVTDRTIVVDRFGSLGKGSTMWGANRGTAAVVWN
jgi:hypothetical protein